MKNQRTMILLAGLTLTVLAVNCESSSQPVAVPSGELFENLSIPEVAAAKRETLSRVYTQGPAHFEAIECENTYLAGAVPPDPAVPTLWLVHHGKNRRVAGYDRYHNPEPNDWSAKRWSADFSSGDERLICARERRTTPTVGKAWLTYTYPRALLDGIEWLRPANRSPTSAEVDEVKEMSQDGWTRGELERLIEIRPHTDNWGGVSNGIWIDAIEAASRLDSDIEFELRRRYRYAGGCGRDHRYKQFDAALRNLCLMTGRFDCAAELMGLVDPPPFPQPPATAWHNLPEGTDRFRYEAGLALRFPGSFNEDMYKVYPSIQTEEDADAFRELFIEIGADPKTDAFNRYRMASLAVGVATNYVEYEDRPAILREIAEEEWIPSAYRSRLLRQVDAYAKLVEADAKGELGPDAPTLVFTGPDTGVYVVQNRSEERPDSSD